MSTRTISGRIGHCIAEQETILECLARHFELARERSEWLIAFGGVFVDKKRVGVDRALSPGQYVRVHFDPKRYPVEGIDWRAAIVQHHDEFLVVNKPPGIPVHPTVDNQIENVVRQISVALGVPLHVTQRLDTDVGGLLIIAKTQEFQREFNRLLVDRKVKKRYRALVSSPPNVGRHVHYMEPSKRGPKTVSTEPLPNWLECALSVVSVGPTQVGLTEIEIDLETGRTHQIRAQLAAIGSPLVGDTLYGSTDVYDLSGIGLFSVSVSWSGADGRDWAFALSPPWT